jgi:hypothetical protein
VSGVSVSVCTSPVFSADDSILFQATEPRRDRGNADSEGKSEKKNIRDYILHPLYFLSRIE